ncbi:TetR/AcrR family transcriptional regulator [Isoptericola variabilis]|uniref:Regulatory protein TetR n=1 Tax=Isoptericola variabilis (strain 225) TaxID=743718 RepID=F6FSC2_ISOV2|nr:TetR/AcrR family transcriptional regulator [Isoptericola variabilis]AEG43063.1 regulatory protein TetR [Isoptericola variabilis 225]TWH28154.1 TetR family transcriptional regulator [Isoptericola variabilis J7]
MTTESRVRSPRRERTRERLLDAAFDVFAELGVQGASIEAVCEAAGFTRGAFYSNFASKEELFLALMDREKRRHLATLEQFAQRLDPAEVRSPEGIRTVLRSVLAAVGPHPDAERRWCVMSAEFELLALRDPSVAAGYLAEQRALKDELAATISRLLDALGLRFVVEPRTAVDLLLAAYAEASRAVLLGAPDDEGPNARIEQLVDVLLAPRQPAK